MIRYSEVVLPGHPDKLCDAIANSIIEAVTSIDPVGYGHIEVSVWDYHMWLTGGVVIAKPLPKSFEEIARETAIAIGYDASNIFDANKMEIRSTVCTEIGDGRKYTGYVTDQCISVGWAGYDDKVDFLPPEHFLCRRFAAAVTESCKKGLLEGNGPDGKFLIRIREEGNEWHLEHVLTTIQQAESSSLTDLTLKVFMTLEEEYREIQSKDPRWKSNWDQVEGLVNPNGPLVHGGPLGDNGQTGRKLVMDYYGPRIPIGGGALYGKDPRHIDRFASRKNREAAIHAVKTGAKSCMVTTCYAPNIPEPVDIRIDMEGRGERLPKMHWNHNAKD